MSDRVDTYLSNRLCNGYPNALVIQDDEGRWVACFSVIAPGPKGADELILFDPKAPGEIRTAEYGFPVAKAAIEQMVAYAKA